MHVDKSKGVVVEELQLAIIIFEGGSQLFAANFSDLIQEFIDAGKRHVSYRLLHEFFHAFGVEPLQSVLKGLVCVDAVFELKRNFAVVGRVGFVDELANKKGDKPIKGGLFV